MITIYGKSACPFCVKAKEFCEQKGIAYEYISLEGNETLRDMMRAAGMRTVPCVFEGENLIGGYDSLVEKFS